MNKCPDCHVERIALPNNPSGFCTCNTRTSINCSECNGLGYIKCWSEAQAKQIIRICPECGGKNSMEIRL